MRLIEMKSLIVLFFIVATPVTINSEYKPTWESLDSRPLPAWYDDSKVGIFIHWGVFSVPAFGSEWFWWNWRGLKDHAHVDFVRKNFRPGTHYADFARDFRAEFFDPNQWAKIFAQSGAKYVVLTSKHHEGFTLWPSNYSFNWNAGDVGPGKDLIGPLANATRQQKLHFGLYHSLFEWFNPLFLTDQSNGYKTKEFVKRKSLPELYELVNRYKPDVIWSDGDCDGPDTYWQSKEFLAWLYNKSPVRDTVVTNDRWGIGLMCNHGGFLTCADRFIPGKLLPKKWENAMTLDKNSWGYVRNRQISDYLTASELVATLVKTVSLGGNILINVGPTADGRIDPIQEERLLQLGAWLKINGPGIYNTKPWLNQNDTLTKEIWYTQSKEKSEIYCIFLNWPENDSLQLGSLITTGTSFSKISFLDQQQTKPVTFVRNEKTIEVRLDNIRPPNNGISGWTLKIE